MNKKRLKGILRTVILVLLSLLLGVNIYLWNAQNVAGNALPMPFGFGVAVVLTGSMEPALSANDVIIVQQQEDYVLRDIVVYQSGGSLVVHRIIETDGENVTTQGDANNTADTPIRAEFIKGKVVGHIPGLGMVIKLLKTPVVIIGLAVAAFFLLEQSYRKEKKQDQDKLEDIKAEIRRLKAEQEEQK